ncbi:MAG TPA: cellulase N-terminal Ig-like domain-containing protein, partial [Longimicrobiaceae bacterium]|nr:cellulase N-terminal Ig-like domain-containing protein [Longimicrobiaceae bacterium]
MNPMMRHPVRAGFLALLLAAAGAGAGRAQAPTLKLSADTTLSARGLDVLVFNNWYSGLFSDSKLSGVELIQHGVRIATNGDVRLSNTPGQWDPIPTFSGRRLDGDGGIEASLAYPDYAFHYRVQVRPSGEGFLVRVVLDQPLPERLEGRAGFNLEFLPSAYFGKAYLMDGRPGQLPRAAGDSMYRDPDGALQAAPFATGGTLVLAPGDPERRVTIQGHGATLSLYDGRDLAQNGWYVVRTPIPAHRTGTVVEWLVTPSRIPGWTRAPVIAHSQVGYHPDQEKVAILELDPNYAGPLDVTLTRITPDGRSLPVLHGEAQPWGRYLRYHYARFDFSAAKEPGLYVLEFGGVRTE